MVTKVALNGANLKIINVSAKLCDVSVNELRNIAYKICGESNLNDFKQMVSYIIQMYIFDQQKSIDSIRSRDYLLTMLEIYKKTNVKDNNLVGMRKLLDKWLIESGITKRITRKATLNNFKKAMFVFVVLTIQDNM